MTKLLYVSTRRITSRDKKYLSQLADILSPYENFSSDSHHEKGLIKELTLESDQDIDESSIALALKGRHEAYDWVHIEMNDSNWKALGIRDSLWGQSREVNGTIFTYGRWSDFSTRTMASLVEHEYPDLYEHVLGMIHEYFHAKEGNLALVHSYIYGYDRVYSKAEERAYKPKRYQKMSSLKKLLECIFNKKEVPHTEPEKTEYGNDFNKAVKIILHHEGGYVNDKRDPGGETNFGISKRAYPLVDIKNLTIEEATDIYYKDYWLAASCEKMNYSSALNVFDMAVNAGVGTSIKLMQRALNVKDDGYIGPISLAAINNSSETLYNEFVGERIKHYGSLSIWDVYMNGWVNRTIYTLNESIK